METYLIAHLKLKYGQLEAASEVLGKLVPILEGEGWKLISAHRTLIGDLNQVIDIWQIPDANAAYTSIEAAIASSPEFGELLGKLSDMVVDEHLSVTAKTSYSN